MKKDFAINTDKISEFFISDLLISELPYIKTDFRRDILYSNKIPRKTKIITEISSLPESKLLLTYHLGVLKRKNFDILLIKVSQFWENYLSETLSYDLSKEYGISGEIEMSDIEKFKELTGKYPTWISIKLNPRYFQKDLIDYCRERDIKIIAERCIFPEDLLLNFSEKFLLEFCFFYSDLIIIPSDNTDLAIRSIWFCKEFDDSNLDPKKYYLSNPIKLDIQEKKEDVKVLNRYLKFSEELKLPIIGDDYIPDNLVLETLSPLEINLESSMDPIYEDLLSLKSDYLIDLNEKFAYYRYLSVSLVKKSYSSKYWRVALTILNNTVLISVKFKYFKLFKPTCYILSLDQEEIYWKKL